MFARTAWATLLFALLVADSAWSQVPPSQPATGPELTVPQPGDADRAVGEEREPAGVTGRDRVLPTEGTPTQPGSNGTTSLLENWGKSDYLTLVIAIFTGLLAWISYRSKQNFQRSERAYVQLSHAGPLTFANGGIPGVPMETKNWGKTPATVTDIILGIHQGKNLPKNPEYDRCYVKQKVQAVLVTHGYFGQRVEFNPLSDVPTGDNLHDHTIWIFGYVEYSDIFGDAHRAGYARRFVPSLPCSEKDNNLVYANQVGYEYDEVVRR